MRLIGIKQDIVSGDGFTPLPSFDDAVKEAKDKICVFGSVCEGHEALWRMRGPEGTYMDLATDPEKVKKFVENIGDYMLEIGRKQLEFAGVKGMVIWGDVAYNKGILFSPEIWKQIFYPVVKKMCKEFHDKGALVIYHGCGDSRAILDDLIEVGIDGYHTLQVSAGMDVIELKKKYKNKLAYLGNIDAGKILPGSKEEMKKNLLYKLNAAIGGGYMPAADHSVPGNVSGENYDYFVKLLNEYGKYPLKLE